MHEYAFMRTTLELPDELMKRAKIEAVERGIPLKELIGSALARELGLASRGARWPRRVNFPIFDSESPGSLELSGEEIARAEAQEDARRHGLPR